MADARAPAIFTIPVHRAFADAFAEGVMAAHKHDPLSLARGLVLLPTNRAVQAIRDGFVRRAEPGLLLPRLAAIGDADLDESIGAALDPLEDVPPAVDPLQRQAMLARLIQQEIGGGAAEAMRLARELGRTRDQLLIERVDPSRLKAIGDERLSEHWQVSLRRLTTMLDAWPRVLAASGHIDLAERRNRLLDRLAARWAQTPPPGFIIAAGIDSAAPAIGNLLKTISRLPHGQVVFAGLDLDSSDEEWARIADDGRGYGLESHPQYHLRQLLTQIGAGRGEVRLWPDPGRSPRSYRTKLASLAFAPAEMTARWHALAPGRRQVAGIAGLELETPAEEAQAIAIALRQAVETPGRAAALITPDRDLATRVSALLRRWNIRADDSAGTPLSATMPGSLLLALATALAESFAPVPLMALLKHPLVRSEDAEARLAWLEGARALDKALRGPRPASGLAGVAAHVATRSCAEWWGEASALLAPLETAAPALFALIDLLSDAATRLGGERVWAGLEGRALSGQMTALREGLRAEPLDGGAEVLPQILRDRFDMVAVRPPAGGHPRIAIWGLIEARLQRADLVVLGGLNEGVWPGLPAPDPWLAPQIRRELQLPALERRIGLSAHDLASALGAPELLLTRAKRDASAPTTASRFWLRLDTLTGGLPRPATPYDLLARALDAGDGEPNRAPRTAPAPPAAERPRTVSVTDVDRLAADPYAFYARSILKLSRLEPLDAAAEAAWRGQIVHKILQLWAEQDGYAPDRLVARMREALDSPAVHPLTRTLQLPQLIEAAQWIESEVDRGRAEGRAPLVSEHDGAIEIAGVTLKGRADRIDRTAGGLAIVDYKTGAAPSRKQVASGYAMQLALLGAIADRGGFPRIEGTSDAFEYWSLSRDSKSRGFGKIDNPCGGKDGIAPEDFVAKGVAQFESAAARWLTGDEPFRAKRAPDYTYDEYDQLMRLEEWDGRDG